MKLAICLTILLLSLLAISFAEGVDRSSISFDIKKFHAKNYSVWLSAFNVSEVNWEYLNSGKWVDDPASTWQTLLRVKYYLNTDFAQGSSCIFYKIPLRKLKDRFKDEQLIGRNVSDDDFLKFNSGLGVLKVITIPEKHSCDGYRFSKSNNHINNVVDLKIYIPEKSMSLDTGLEIEKGDLLFVIEVFDIKRKVIRKHNISFSLKNLRWEGKNKILPSSRVTKIYAPSVKYGGMLTLPVLNYQLKKQRVGFRPEIIGELKDSYLDRTAIKCHQVDSNCQTVKKFDCDRCRWGWFETIGSGCPNGGDKYCGISRCGQQGQPACSRGKKLFGSLKQSGCRNSPIDGFCQRGLKLHCDANDVLICL